MILQLLLLVVVVVVVAAAAVGLSLPVAATSTKEPAMRIKRTWAATARVLEMASLSRLQAGAILTGVRMAVAVDLALYRSESMSVVRALALGLDLEITATLFFNSCPYYTYQSTCYRYRKYVGTSGRCTGVRSSSGYSYHY